MNKMKNYQARPVYRFVAGFIALCGWIVALITLIGIEGGFEQDKIENLLSGILCAVFSLSMTYVAIKGELTRLLALFIGFPLWDFNRKK